MKRTYNDAVRPQFFYFLEPERKIPLHRHMMWFHFGDSIEYLVNDLNIMLSMSLCINDQLKFRTSDITIDKTVY